MVLLIPSQPSTVEDENLRIVKASIDAFNAHDVNRAIECDSESIMVYSPQHPKGTKGRDSMITEMTADFVAIPDIRFNIEQIFGDGDSVIVRGVLSGTNTGPLMTLKGRAIKAGKRPIAIPQAAFHRLQDGKIIESYIYWDTQTVLAQLGFLRRNVIRSSAYIVFGLAFIFVNEILRIYPDTILQVAGLLAGAFPILIGARWMVRVLFSLAKN